MFLEFRFLHFFLFFCSEVARHYNKRFHITNTGAPWEILFLNISPKGGSWRWGSSLPSVGGENNIRLGKGPARNQSSVSDCADTT